MKNEDWDINEYQGRRKDQVEYSNKVGAICVLLTLLSILLIFILN